MSDLNPLKVVSQEPEKSRKAWLSSRHNYRQEAQAKFDRLWLHNPLQFDPLRNAMERTRLERMMDLITKNLNLTGKKAVDLGCGSGIFSRRLHILGAVVDAVDIAPYALERLEEKDSADIIPIHDYVPRTRLADDSYDLVVAAELIAYLHPDEHRLFMSELARIVKPNGYVLCSTPLDINSDDALARFDALSSTEFMISDWVTAHHKYWIRLHDFAAFPERVYRASKNPSYRKQKLELRYGFARYWFKVNSVAPISYFWYILNFVFKPIDRWFSQSETLLIYLEKLCRTLSPVRGISHAIWIGKRKPLQEHTPVEDQPIERKGKRQVWE